MNKTLKEAIKLIDTEYTHVLEFGVYKGSTIKQLRDDLDAKYEIFGFDSFEGLPEDWEGTPLKQGFFSTEGTIPNIENVFFYKGWFNATIPQYKEAHAKSIALLHVDCDLYSSTVDILYGLNDYIQSGTIIVFDEWYYNHHDIEQNRQHEQKAFFEWIKSRNQKYIVYPEFEQERKIIKLL
jgi:hypothetical protein